MPKKWFIKIMISVKEKVWTTEFRSSKISSKRNICSYIDLSFFRDAFNHIMPMIRSFFSFAWATFSGFQLEASPYITFNRMPSSSFQPIFVFLLCFVLVLFFVLVFLVFFVFGSFQDYFGFEPFKVLINLSSGWSILDCWIFFVKLG